MACRAFGVARDGRDGRGDGAWGVYGPLYCQSEICGFMVASLAALRLSRSSRLTWLLDSLRTADGGPNLDPRKPISTSGLIPAWRCSRSPRASGPGKGRGKRRSDTGWTRPSSTYCGATRPRVGSRSGGPGSPGSLAAIAGRLGEAPPGSARASSTLPARRRGRRG